MGRFGRWRQLGGSGNDVILLIGELEYKYSLLDGLLPGVLELGLARNTDGIVSSVPFPSEWGYYLQWEQLIYRERTCNPDDAQGLGVFALYLPRFGGGPVTVSTLETIEDSAAAGFVYRGLVPGRDDDRPQFATSQTDRGWTNLGVEFGPPTRVGVDHRGHERNLPICTGHIDLVRNDLSDIAAGVITMMTPAVLAGDGSPSQSWLRHTCGPPKQFGGIASLLRWQVGDWQVLPGLGCVRRSRAVAR